MNLCYWVASTGPGPSPDEYWKWIAIGIGVAVFVGAVIRTWLFVDSRWMKVSDYERDRETLEKQAIADGARQQKLAERIERLAELHERSDERANPGAAHRR